ncbi:MAG: ABC transporter permease [Armatimonadetes bacterium]|nr:ABC transporter permease [Armatimonadota bacterium]
MGRYLFQRLSLLVPVMLGVTLVAFITLHLAPGDPVRVLLGELGQGASQEEIARLRSTLGLDAPLPVQYGRFVWRAAQGDLGRSLRTGAPVLDEVLARAPFTLVVTVASLGIALAIGIPAGVLSAAYRGSAVDHAAMLLALMGVSLPVFWLGLLLMLVFALALGWLPASGFGTWKHLVLPAVTLGLASSALIARMTRSSLLEVLGQDYIRTARAKGLSGRIVLLRHALRSALIPIVTVVGLQLGGLLGGAVLTETVFAWPGLGRLAVGAIYSRDAPLVQGTILFTAIAFVLINLAVDLLYAMLDPRIRYD